MEKEDYIFGTRAIAEAINSGKTIDKILIRKGTNNSLFQELYEKIKNNKIPFQFVPEEKINRITRKNHQGVVALLSPIEFQKTEELLPTIFETGKDPLLLILDQISDVRNFGAIVRSAECAGVNAIIIPDKGSAQINSDAVKTSAGAIFNIPVCRESNLQKTILYLKESGVKIIAATEKAGQLFYKTKLDIPVAIIMGSEENGVSPALLGMADESVKIPVLGKIESLNVSVACALMVYEAVKQRESN